MSTTEKGNQNDSKDAKKGTTAGTHSSKPTDSKSGGKGMDAKKDSDKKGTSHSK